jgi:hypothetical protein
MRNKIALMLIVPCALASLLIASGMIAGAQAPINDDPVRALYMYDRPYTVPANTWIWFKFDYSGDRTKLILITIPNGHNVGLDFRLYTEEQVVHINDDKFVARGNVAMVPCDTGKCESPDLNWQGTFNLAGTFYVAVINPKNVSVPFHILISGEGVSLGNEPPPLVLTVATNTPPGGIIIPEATTTPLFANTVAPTATSSASTGITATTPTATSVAVTGLATLTPIVPVIVPPVGTVPTPTSAALGPGNNSPYNAVYIPDNRPQSIAANSELWYKFDYTGDRSKITLTLPNGNAWGFDFKLYTSDQAFRVYDEDKFVGRGSAVNQPCDTGRCTADDLTWIGTFNLAGTYFVRVINTKPLPQTFVLQIAGTAINILGQ